MQEELDSLRAIAEPRELGNLTLAAENARQAWHFTSFTGVAADIRFALRTVRRQPGLVAVAVVSVALGVGANSAIFSFVDAMLLRPLPVPRASEVLRVTGSTPTMAATNISHPDYRDIREGSRSFTGLVAYRTTRVRIANDGAASPHLRAAMMVSANFFKVLGIEPPLGRTFLTEETDGAHPSAILAHDVWVNEFGRDRTVIGRTLRINGLAFTIVGVAPASFPGMGTWFSLRPYVFVPLSMWNRLESAGADPLEDRSRVELSVAGRLRRGVSRGSARAELATIGRNLGLEHPTTNRNRRIVLRTELAMRMAQDGETVLFSVTLVVLAGLLLLVACFSVAGLLLARAHGRSREIAIRLALGAGRVRLVRQLMTENLLVALLGGVAGVGVARLGISFLNRFQPTVDLPTLFSGARLDSRVLLFSLLAALGSCLLFGLVPALHTARSDLVSAVKSAGQPSGRRRRLLGRNLLVVGQFALTMVLLIVGGMMVEGLRRMHDVDLGFQRDHVTALQTNPTVLSYSPERTRRFYRELAERARALPGVRSVTVADDVPLQLDDYVVVPEGHRAPEGMAGYDVRQVVCDEEYLATLKIPLLRGRAFTAGDRDATPRVALVNQEFVHQYWPNQAAVGKRLGLERADGLEAEVVGVVDFPGRESLLAPPSPTVFLPYDQNRRPRMTLIVEHYGGAAALAAPLRGVVHALDPQHPIPEVRTLSSYEREQADAWGAIVQWMLALGVMGLTLALVGLYALMSYSVSRRTAEIGVRMAVGSTRAGVLRLVIGQGVTVAATGVAIAGALIGLAHAALAGSWIVPAVVTLLPPNAPTYVAVPLAVLVISALASYAPARRAASIDPIQALRYE